MNARTLSRGTLAIAIAANLTLVHGCSDSTGGSGDDAGQSGGASSGGNKSTGGASSGGGSSATGGATSSGGTTGSGGASATGGTAAATGGSGSGGSGPVGGSGGTPTGDAAVTGGAGGSGENADAGDVGKDALPSDGGPSGVRLSGRIDMTNKDRPTFGWSGSAIYARFNGTGATLRLDGSANQYQVVVDGTPTSVLKFVSGTTQYQLASGLSAGTHEVVVWKRTEGNMGNNSYVGIDVTGGQLLSASAAPDRRIELYGDSISAGYGLDGKLPCTASQDNENHYLTYAAIAARTLSAELHAIAWSGIGMYRNYNQAGPSTDAMPAVYGKTLAYESTPTWNFASWHPHAIVVNLGTNDASTKGDPGTPYETAYLGFVRTLRQKHPDAFFVLSIGPMLDGDQLTAIRTHIKNVIKTRNDEGDTKLSYLEFPVQVQSDGLGCDYHPSPTTNSKMATQLVAELKTRLSW